MNASLNEASIENVRMRFLAACQSSPDGCLPEIEEYLAPFQEPERSSLRARLEEIQHQYVSGKTEVKGTRAERSSETRHEESDGTGEYRSAPEVTGEFRSTPEVTGEYRTAPEATGEYRSSLHDSAHGTEPEASGEPAVTLGTSEYSPEGRGSGIVVKSQKRASAGSPPMSVAGYEILDILGRGAMGVVYKARQRGLQRLVALKMILSGEHASAQDLGRFQAEANAVAQLQHPGIVQIYEVGEDNGRPFFSLEFVDGPSLHKKVQSTPLPPKEAAQLLLKMAEAMHYAHQRGIIHRDLKPANVLMTSDGIPKIGDFGLAKRLEDDESGLTRTGTVLGTPSYMSPEQASGKNEDVGPLADVYSLGAILYDMLTGRPPFRGTSVMDTLQQLRTREPVPPIQLQASVPRDLETICLKCLDKDRAKRYADAGALADDLGRYLRGEPILARPISPVERLWRWCKRNPGKAAAATAAMLGIIIYAASVSILAGIINQEKKTAEDARNIAIEKKNEADEAKDEALRQSVIAKAETKEANRQRERMRQTSTVTIDSLVHFVDRLQTRLHNKKLALDANPGLRKLRGDLIADARTSLAAISQRIQSTATATFAELYAAQLIGELLMKLGQSKEPREIYEAALKSANDRVQAEPNNDRARGNLGIIEQQLGKVALEMDGNPKLARDHFEKCRNLHQEIKLHPKADHYTPRAIDIALSHDDVNLAKSLIALGRAEEAKSLLHESLQYRNQWLADTPKGKNAEPRSYVMEAQMWLGIASVSLGDKDGVREHFDISLAIGKTLLAEYPNVLSFKVDYADVLGASGEARMRMGQLVDAENQLTESLAVLKQVIAKKPDDIGNQPLLALAHERLGNASLLLKKEAEAKRHFQEAAQLRKELWEIEKASLAWQINFVTALAREGKLPDAMRLGTAIRPRMTKSPILMLQVARCFAVCARADIPEKAKNIEQSLSALKAAIGKDYQDATFLLSDPDLSAIQNETAFKELMAIIQKR